MRIKLNSTKISAFQNLGEDQFVEFDQPGLVGVIGDNKDEGGSNASGKSSLVRAITTGILGPGYVNISISKMKNRRLDIPTRIVNDLTINDKHVVIDRTLGGKVILTVDGIEEVGKSDEIQSKINALFTTSPEHIIHLTHKMQGPFGGFLLMKDAEKKDFLGSFFDTTKIDTAAAQNAARVTELTAINLKNSQQLTYAVNSLMSLKNDVDAMTNAVNHFTSTEYLSKLAKARSDLVQKEMEQAAILDSNTLAVNDPNINELNEKLEASKLSLRAHESSANAIMENLKREAYELGAAIKAPVLIPEELTNKLALATSSLEVVRKSKEAADRLSAQHSAKLAETAKIHAKLHALKQDVCNTCNQPVSTEIFNKIKESIASELQKATDEANSLKDKVALYVIGLDKEASYQIDQNSANNEIAIFKAGNSKSHLTSILSGVEAKMSAIMAQKREIETAIYNTTKSIEFLVESAQKNYKMQEQKVAAEISLLKNQIKILESDAVNAKNLLQKASDKHALQSNQISILEKSVAETAKELNSRQKVAEVLSNNGFIGYIFDSVLEEINAETNQNIKDLSVITRLSMYFTPDKNVKTTGTTKKAITSNIFDNGEEISFETLSGAEQQSLVVAVDVAVDTILCRRLGVDINYKILDEQFGFVDGVNKEPILEFLKTKYNDKVILIVDHGSEVNASIDDKIYVTKQNGIATISCQKRS